MKKRLFNWIQILWYEFFWTGMAISFRFYFKRWQVANYKNVPRKGPTIYASNHQNAFMDALAIIMSNKRHPVFLTRADVFKSKAAAFWLRSVNMIPIYRIRDGKQNISKNDAVIQECVEILSHGRKPLAIFPEGNHSMKRTLRPLKKGLGRIAFAAMEANDFNLDLQVVPIGVNYSRPTRFRGNLLVNYGKPIDVKDYVGLYRDNPNQAFLALKDELTVRIKELIVDIHSKDHYEEIERIWAYEKEEKDNMLDELHADQAKISQLIKEADAGNLSKHVEHPRRMSKPWLKMIFGLPIFLYGALNHLLTHFIIDRFIAKAVSDVHFYGSMKIAVGMFLVPIIYLLQTWGVYAFTNSLLIAVLYFLTLPFAGIFSYDYKDRFIQGTPPIELTASHFNS
jgi:1-acyl-sn-glycerol-3-phosphate acyltransferase